MRSPTRHAPLTVALALFLGGCSPVTSTPADAGIDSGPSCPGEQDEDGNCICQPREAGDSCGECAPRWSAPGSGCAEFFDDFDRPAGPLGEGWEALSLPIAEDAVIVSSRACGDVQSVALVAEPVTDSVRATFQFEAAGIEGLEGGFLLADEGIDTVFIAGCDGGGGECILKISRTTEVLDEEAVPAVVPNQTYTFELDLNGRELSLEILEGAQPVGSVAATLPANFQMHRLGILTGREADSSLTCIDDFTVTIRSP